MAKRSGIKGGLWTRCSQASYYQPEENHTAGSHLGKASFLIELHKFYDPSCPVMSSFAAF